MKYYVLQHDDEDEVFLALQIDHGWPQNDRPYFGFMQPKSILLTVSRKTAESYANTHDASEGACYIVPEDELQLFLAEQKLRRT